MHIEVTKAGFMTTVQDNGRPGYGHIGIPGSGYMDQFAAKVANKMVGNDDNTALLEVDVAGIALTVHVDCSVAIAGAHAHVAINQQIRETSACIELCRGDHIEIKPLTGGMWSYLAFAGGLAADEVLGSTSTLLLAQIGGHHGRRLNKGDTLTLKAPSPIKGQSKAAPQQRPHNTIHSLAAVRGPEYDLFTPESGRLLTSQAFKMTEHISRQGMKITGPQLTVKNREDINSSGLVPGSLQVTPSGEYIVTHRDSQTIGGYPRIMVLQRSALSQLAQVRPGEQIYFYFNNESH